MPVSPPPSPPRPQPLSRRAASCSTPPPTTCASRPCAAWALLARAGTLGRLLLPSTPAVGRRQAWQSLCTGLQLCLLGVTFLFTFKPGAVSVTPLGARLAPALTARRFAAAAGRLGMLDGVGSTAAVLLAESALVAAACVLAHCALTALFVAVGIAHAANGEGVGATHAVATFQEEEAAEAPDESAASTRAAQVAAAHGGTSCAQSSAMSAVTARPTSWALQPPATQRPPSPPPAPPWPLSPPPAPHPAASAYAPQHAPSVARHDSAARSCYSASRCDAGARQLSAAPSDSIILQLCGSARVSTGGLAPSAAKRCGVRGVRTSCELAADAAARALVARNTSTAVLPSSLVRGVSGASGVRGVRGGRTSYELAVDAAVAEAALTLNDDDAELANDCGDGRGLPGKGDGGGGDDDDTEDVPRALPSRAFSAVRGQSHAAGRAPARTAQDGASPPLGRSFSDAVLAQRAATTQQPAPFERIGSAQSTTQQPAPFERIGSAQSVACACSDRKRPSEWSRAAQSGATVVRRRQSLQQTLPMQTCGAQVCDAPAAAELLPAARKARPATGVAAVKRTSGAAREPPKQARRVACAPGLERGWLVCWCVHAAVAHAAACLTTGLFAEPLTPALALSLALTWLVSAALLCAAELLLLALAAVSLPPTMVARWAEGYVRATEAARTVQAVQRACCCRRLARQAAVTPTWPPATAKRVSGSVRGVRHLVPELMRSVEVAPPPAAAITVSAEARVPISPPPPHTAPAAAPTSLALGSLSVTHASAGGDNCGWPAWPARATSVALLPSQAKRARAIIGPILTLSRAQTVPLRKLPPIGSQPDTYAAASALSPHALQPRANVATIVNVSAVRGAEAHHVGGCSHCAPAQLDRAADATQPQRAAAGTPGGAASHSSANQPLRACSPSAYAPPRAGLPSAMANAWPMVRSTPPMPPMMPLPPSNGNTLDTGDAWRIQD